MQTKKIIFQSNLHANTFYCDGKNNAENYILKAIEKEFKSISLSDHSFKKFDKEWQLELSNSTNKNFWLSLFLFTFTI